MEASLCWSDMAVVERQTFLEVRYEAVGKRSRSMSDSMIGVEGHHCNLENLKRPCACDELTSVGQDSDVGSCCSTDNSWSTDNEDSGSDWSGAPAIAPGQWMASACMMNLPTIWGLMPMQQPQRVFPRECVDSIPQAPACRRTDRAKKHFPSNTIFPVDDDNACKIPAHGRTTIIFRNVPHGWTRCHLAALLNSEGFQSCFDFVHVPVNFKGMNNLGYGLANMVSNAEAYRVLKHFQGLPLTATERCAVDWSSPSQGLQAHVDRYQNSPMMHDSVPDEYKPALFRNGIIVPFPEPIKKLRAPRVRHPKTKDNCLH